ncbi:PLP-dependent aminotransferase family protein [Candidatus Uabimicrobium sp. HlEnr_7]|uniref:aminotransferase-like domain-containing protein n=1 Tax=Candidatus Uabimicrobium helgolandensis TaxID=3095367 RepID=UPI003558D094
MEIINFGKGYPANVLLPHTLMQKACESHLQEEKKLFLHYGHKQGEEKFRELLASFLQQNYKTAIEKEDLLITCGASQGLDLICQHFTKPGDTIFIEEPSYFLVFKIFTDRGLNLVPINTGKNGLDLAELESKLKAHNPVFFYTIPTFQNPGGTTLQEEQRQKLVALSEKHDFLIVADEVYHLLDYSMRSPFPFCHYSKRVLSLGSFSKILAPGLRLGWIHCCSTLLNKMLEDSVLGSGGGFNRFISGQVYSFIKLGFQQQHLKLLIGSYRLRSGALYYFLTTILPDVICSPPEGGYFLWVELPKGINAQQLLERAKKHGVTFHPGYKFSTQKKLNNFIRLSFSFYDCDILEEGIRRLAKCF